MHDQATRLRDIAQRYNKNARGVRPHVITVTSGKGGVGKSTVALNLALALSDFGQRVLLFDADANLSSLDVMLGVSPRFRLGDVLRGTIDIEDALFSPHPNLKILPGSSGDAGYPILTGEAQTRLMDDLLSLDERFDLLMVDTAAGLTPEVVGFAGRADEAIVVSSTEPTSVMDAYAIMKIISMGWSEVPIALLLNSVRTPKDGDDAARKLQAAVDHFLKRQVAFMGSVPFDASVQKASKEQRALVQAYPRSAASLSLRSIAHYVLHEFLHSSVRRVASI